MENSFKILTSKQERELSHDELINYYCSLRNYLLYSKPEHVTKGALGICEKINPIISKTLNKFCGYDIEVENSETYKGITGIYAHSHQSKQDHIGLIVSNPNHTIILNSSVLSQFYKSVINLNGVIYVNKQSKEEKNNAKIEMMRLLLNDKSITIFPESAWNLSPNKLHLPLYSGIMDVAKKTGKPVIPVVQEYYYDESKKDGKERIKKVFIKYGTPIYVGENDDIYKKLAEYSEQIATMRWELIEKKGMYHRESISNYDYINYLKGNIRNLKNAGVDINVEEEGIFGSNSDFYLFHNLNAVKYSDSGELLIPEYTRKVYKLYDDNFKK